MLTAKLKGEKRLHATWEAVQKGGFDWACGVCDEPVTLVQPSKRNGFLLTHAELFARENDLSFRHTKQPLHPVRPANAFRNDAFRVIYGLLAKSGYEISTDQPTGGKGDFSASDLTVFDKEKQQTAIFIEPGNFRFPDLESTVRALSANGISTMVVLSAWDDAINKDGEYLRPARVFEKGYRRHAKYTIIRGNEQQVVDWHQGTVSKFGTMSYFSHKNSQLLQVSFDAAMAPLIRTEQSDNELWHIVMNQYGKLVDADTQEIKMVRQPFRENRQVKRNGAYVWETTSGVREVPVIIGKGQLLKVFRNYRDIQEQTPVTELALMHRTTSKGYKIAFPTPVRHLEARRNAEAPVQLALGV